MPDTRNQKKPRKCLHCLNTFESEWAGNRICGKCTIRNDSSKRGQSNRFQEHDYGFDALAYPMGRRVPAAKGLI